MAKQLFEQEGNKEFLDFVGKNSDAVVVVRHADGSCEVATETDAEKFHAELAALAALVPTE